MSKLGRPKTGNAMVMIGVRVTPEVWTALELEAGERQIESAGILAREILSQYVLRRAKERRQP